MAITKETIVQRVEVYPSKGDAKPAMMIVYQDTFDDPDDDLLPHTSNRVIHLSATVSATDEDGNVTVTDTDVSMHDPLVQAITEAVWAD